MTSLLEVDGLVKEFPARGGVGARGRRRVVRRSRRARRSVWWGSRGAASRRSPGWWYACSKPSKGSIRVDGDDIAHLSRRALRSMRRRVQIVFQDPYSSLDPRMTARAIVAEPLRIAGRSREIGTRVPEVFALVGLGPEHEGRYPARALRRPASAGRHRAGAGGPARAARARRAGHRARRLDPGPDPQPARASSSRSSGSPTSSSRTTSPSSATSPTGSR